MKTGAKMRSAVCSTEVMVIRAGTGDVTLCCGGVPMLAPDESTEAVGAPQAGFDAGTVLGKRYIDTESGVEVLCVKPGAGSVSADDRPLELSVPKALPSSD
ncbi:hypothetical protein [Rhodococcus opacus]|uniref:hypothetical protein n=1 Tax=Rhodococcus opacus TaxID=37919 RepID=UPI000EAA7F13|nr:hypothetical protein [Rhodococcus opacus]QZS52783.1 hypothetical protein FXW36_00900 [Rhodococcus opacus]RKM65219.1 hypothetical protein COO55_40475 [Rhodococcus opacus]